jgi:hypothetical protein
MKGEMRRGLPSPKIMVVDGCLSHEKGRGMVSPLHDVIIFGGRGC